MTTDKLSIGLTLKLIQVKTLELMGLAFILFISLLSPFVQNQAQASESKLPLTLTSNLQALAEEAQTRNAIIVVFFSRPNCPYCKKVEKNHINALVEAGAIANGQSVVVAKIDQTLDASLRDFSGNMTTHKSYAKAQKVSLVPVVGFYDTHGKVLHQPIIGALIDDFYAHYLESAIESAHLLTKNSAKK